ncbi:Bax inhibitor-1/YccA family protein [Dasania marina]|uniref:Bax inhibitor-1/YccA family protein n=1 Tax=Dasania marina TaxID=471499 RepID=UPI000380A38F|nr:Bax inhibitor-1/YccA family protein [Dasania marina]
MQNQPIFGSQTQSTESVLATNKVLRNTYLLLSATLLFSAMTASVAMAMEISRGTSLMLSLIGLGLIFAVHKTADSSKGLVMVFAFTGVLGAALGPMLNYYLSLANGPSLVMQALGGTALVFFTLSGYALTTRKDFSFMGGFLMVGLVVVVIAGLANLFFQVPALSLAISSAVVLIMSGLILFDTSRIVNGGETNYIRATVALYLNIYNLFTSLLHLLGIFGGDD